MSEPSEQKETTKRKAPEWLIENIAESSIHAKRIYILYASVIIYAMLAVVSVSDRQIVLYGYIPLPILKIAVSTTVFFYGGAAPHHFSLLVPSNLPRPSSGAAS